MCHVNFKELCAKLRDSFGGLNIILHYIKLAWISTEMAHSGRQLFLLFYFLSWPPEPKDNGRGCSFII